MDSCTLLRTVLIDPMKGFSQDSLPQLLLLYHNQLATVGVFSLC